MITVDGRQYGTAHEIAAALGPDVSPGMIRNWARRDSLPAIRDGCTVRYSLLDAAIIEATKRRSHRGRPRAT